MCKKPQTEQRLRTPPSRGVEKSEGPSALQPTTEPEFQVFRHNNIEFQVFRHNNIEFPVFRHNNIEFQVFRHNNIED